MLPLLYLFNSVLMIDVRDSYDPNIDLVSIANEFVDLWTLPHTYFTCQLRYRTRHKKVLTIHRLKIISAPYVDCYNRNHKSENDGLCSWSKRCWESNKTMSSSVSIWR